MSPITIVGIDPGISGAIAVIYGGELIEIHDMPCEKVTLGTGKRRTLVNPAALAAILAEVEPDLVVIEDVGSRPGMGAQAAFAFGLSTGICHGIATGYASTVKVRPKDWRKTAGYAGADKGRARAVATDRWPDFADHFARVRDDGRAEAALIAAWALTP